MPSSQPPFDDGGDLPDVDRRDDGVSDRGPNYFVRRVIAVVGAVVVIAAAAVVVGRIVGGDDGADDGGGGGATAEWDTIVLIDQRTDELVLLDDAGDELDRRSSGLRGPVDAQIADDQLVLRGDDRIAVVDLDGGEDPTEFEFAEGTAALSRPSGSTNTLLAGGASGDRLVLVHGPSGDILDTAEIADVAGARYDVALTVADPSGRRVLVTDGGNFQSVLLSFDRDEPEFFPGLALAVDDDAVVTAQNVGSDATISVFDHDGEQITSARTPAVRAAMLTEAGVVLVSVEGEVLTLTFDADEAESGGTMSIGTVADGNVSVNGDRLIVDGEDGVGLVDPEAEIVDQIAGAVRTSFGIDADAPHRSVCVIADRSPPGELVTIDLGSGDILGEVLGGLPAFASVDGCTAIVSTADGHTLVEPAAVSDVTIDGDVVAMAPDGTAVATESGNRLELVNLGTAPIDEASGDEPDGDSTDSTVIDLGRAGRFVRFAER